MKKILIGVFLLNTCFNIVKSTAQTFQFPPITSTSGCTSGDYILTPALTITGIQVKDVYYDDPTSNTGSFAFEVIFSYRNVFSGTLPTSVPNFWQYQVTFNTTNSNISSGLTTNNIGDVPISTHTENNLNLNNNNSYNGSASNLGLTANTFYSQNDIVELFAFEFATLQVNLPCMSESEYSNNTIPLSVKLSALNIQLNQSNLVLDWTTVTEENIAHFDIQKSSDAIAWKTIDKIQSKAIDGNSNQSINYSFTDNNPFDGNNYYRLKIVSKNNEVTYSDVVSHTFDASEITVFPNPTDGIINIKGFKKNDKIQIYNTLGQMVFEQLLENDNQFQAINIQSLENGNYFLFILNDKESNEMHKITIAK